MNFNEALENIKRIENSIIKANPKISLELLLKFATIQARLSHISKNNILALASSAKNEQVNLSDVKTREGWMKVNPKIQPLMADTPLYLYKALFTKEGKKVLKRIPVFDISQTTAPYLDVKSTAISILPNSYSEFIKYFNENLKIIKPELSIERGYENSFSPYSNKIFFNQSESIAQNIDYIFQSLLKEFTYGESLRNYTKLITNDDKLLEAKLKLASQGVCNRVGLDTTEGGDILSLSQINLLKINLSENLSDINILISEFIENTDFNSFLLKTYASPTQNEMKLAELKDIVQKEKEEPQVKKGKAWIDFNTLSDEIAKTLKDKTKEEILATDPSAVIDALQLEVTKSTPTSYLFKARAEKSASASMAIKNGVWLYNDFGGDGGGTVISLVKRVLDCDYRQAITYCCDNLNVPNYFENELEDIKHENELLKKEAWGENYKVDLQQTNLQRGSKEHKESLANYDEKIEALKKQNEELEKTHSVKSRVLSASKVIPQKFITMLNERGITKPDIKNLYYIRGENYGTDPQTGKAWTSIRDGVGVLCAEKENLQQIHATIEEKGQISLNEDREDVKIGADVHFPKYKNRFGDIKKTTSFGRKTNTTFLDNNGAQNSKIAPFESKMDYAAASQIYDFQSLKIDVDIANSTSNADIVGKNIAQNEYKDIIFFNQFDLPGASFILDIYESSKKDGYMFNKFSYIDYKENEFGQDPNDLIKNGVNLSKRFKNGTLNDLYSMVEKLKSNSPEKAYIKIKEKLDRIIEDRQSISVDTQAKGLHLG